MGIRPFLDSLKQPEPERSELIRGHLVEAHLATLRAMALLDEEREPTIFIKLETSILMISSCMYTVSHLDD